MKRASILFGIALLYDLFFRIRARRRSIRASPRDLPRATRTTRKRTLPIIPAFTAFDKAHSFIGFKVRHMGLIEVPGFFRDFTGTVNYDAKDVSKSTGRVYRQGDAAPIPGVKGRDDHLKKPEFFDVEKYPDITFKSTKVEKKGKNWMLTGDFTMKGVTKSITFPFNIAGFLPPGERGAKMGITAETSINRRDYGVNYGT